MITWVIVTNLDWIELRASGYKRKKKSGIHSYKLFVLRCTILLKCHLYGACTHGWRKTWMIKCVSLHLSNRAEWWWILFGNGLHVLKKIRPGTYVCTACMTAWHVVRKSMCVCVFDWPIQLAGRNAAPLAHGWPAVLETPVSHMPSTNVHAHTHICKHACMHTHTRVYAHTQARTPLCRGYVLAKSLMPPVPTHIQHIMDQDRNHFQGSFAVGAMVEKIHRLYGRQHTTENTPPKSPVWVCLPAPMTAATTPTGPFSPLTPKFTSCWKICSVQMMP